MNEIANWLKKNGFKSTSTNAYAKFDKGTLRVAEGCDEVSVIKFTGRPGWTAVAWEVNFPAPEGRLSVPVDVMIATVRASL